MAAAPRIGGSFAPPLDKATLARYEDLAMDQAPQQIAEAMLKLANMLTVFRQTPTSTLPGKPHPSGKGVIIPLTEAEVARIDPVVPWREELDVYAKLFDGIDPVRQKELRDAAFHLLWFGYELYLDREPCTADQL